MKRKSPIKHRVKSHIRKHKLVHSYSRGKGERNILLTNKGLISLKKKIKKEERLPRQYLAFHGTRASDEVLQKQGVVFDANFLINVMKKTAQRLGINYNEWLQTPEGKKFISQVYGGQYYEYRPYVSITAQYKNASSYAYRNPELIFESVSDMYDWKHRDIPENLRSRSYYINQKTEIYRTLRMIGKPRVVAVDVRKLSWKGQSRAEGLTGYDINVYVDKIPKEAIIRVLSAKYTQEEELRKEERRWRLK